MPLQQNISREHQKHSKLQVHTRAAIMLLRWLNSFAPENACEWVSSTRPRSCSQYSNTRNTLQQQQQQ
jgi:hypothetical protein